MDSKGHVRHFFGVRFAYHVLESCCCSDKRLFFMDSKGHVRHFFGVRFAYHVLESCCCSSVSELRTKDCFLWIPERSREALFRRAFCLACARILLLFECFGTADKRVFFMDSKGHVRHFFGVRFASHVHESCCCSSVSELRTKDCFLWIPKVTWGTFSACVLLSMCSNPAAVRVFRNCGQKIVFYGFQRSREALFRRAFCLPCARILLPFECFGTADKRLFFMDSKGHVRHFFGVRFA